MLDPAPRSSAVDSGPLSPGQVRALKIAIVVMAILIVLGLVGVIARIMYLASTKPTARPVASQATPSAVEARIPVPAGAVVKSMTLDGDRMALHFESPTGAGITIVDVASGKVVSRWHLVPEPPR